MNIDLKSLIEQAKNGKLNFELPNGLYLTIIQGDDNSLKVHLNEKLLGTIEGKIFHDVMKPLTYDDGVYVFHTDSGVNKDNFKETYDKYKEKNQLGGYGKFCATYSGSTEYLKGIVDAIWLTNHLDHIEVKDGKIIGENPEKVDHHNLCCL